MPRYYFHLSSGSRTLPDEEGVELSSRAAAREEALAVVRDIAARKDSKSLAGWFVQIADREGSFLRVPIGGPALALVMSSQTSGVGRERNESVRGVARNEGPAAMGTFKPTALTREVLFHLRRAAELAQRTRDLQVELATETLKYERILAETRHLLALARSV